MSFVFDGPLSELSAKQCAGWLGTRIGEQGREIYKSLTWADGEKDDPAKVHDIALNKGSNTRRKASIIFFKDLKIIIMDCEYTDPDDMVDAIIARVGEKQVQE